MEKGDRTEFVHRWWASFNEGGRAPLQLCDEEVVIANPPEFPVRGTFRGHDGALRWSEQVFEVMDGPRVSVEEVVEAPDPATAVARLRLQGIAIYTRIEIDAPWAAVMKIGGGKLLHAQGYLDSRAAFSAAGIKR